MFPEAYDLKQNKLIKDFFLKVHEKGIKDVYFGTEIVETHI